jgi:hypothetical protein
MFENKLINGVHATRYIASWCNEGGKIRSRGFREWLWSLGLTVDEVQYIFNIATNGKLELEFSAEEFMRQQ